MEACTTVAAMAKHLRRYRQLTVIGNGSGTMNELAPLVPDLTVYCCGGMLRGVAHTFVGPQAEEYFRHINASTCFLSATGVSFPEGITDVSLLEIQVKRAIARNAGQVVFLMDSTKFGAKSFARVLDFDHIQVLVTDDGAPAAYVEQCRPPASRFISCRVAGQEDDLPEVSLSGLCGSYRCSEKESWSLPAVLCTNKRGPPPAQWTPLLPVRNTAQPQCSRGCPVRQEVPP